INYVFYTGNIAKLRRDMARDIWFADLAVLTEECRRDGIRCPAVETARERNNFFTAGCHSSHPHRIFVRLSARIAEKRLSKALWGDRDKLFSRLCPDTRINEI